MNGELYRFYRDLREDGVPLQTMCKWTGGGTLSQGWNAMIDGLKNGDLSVYRKLHQEWLLQRERTERIMGYHFVLKDGFYQVPCGFAFRNENLWDGDRPDVLWWLQEFTGFKLPQELDWHSAVTQFCDEVWSAIAKESAVALFGR